jgi:hypothetical protein
MRCYIHLLAQQSARHSTFGRCRNSWLLSVESLHQILHNELENHLLYITFTIGAV